MLTRLQVTLRAKIDHGLTQQARVLAMGLTASSLAVGLRAETDFLKTLFRVGEPGSEGPKDRERERPDEPFLAPRSRTELFFIDAAVADPQAFWLAAPRGATVICIPREVDSWEFMARESARFRGLGAIHIISHGQPGALVLNGCRYTAADLSPKAALLYKLGQALTKNGDILLYGCDTGEGVEGARLVTELADFTGADVGASSNLTGGLPGDDWKLEVTHGVLTTLPVAPVEYNHELSTTTVSTIVSLKNAIATGSTNGSDDTIILTANITFAAPSNAIVINVTDGHTLTILGGGFTLSGNNLARVLDVSTSGAGSAVVIDNLTIAKGFSSGLGGNRVVGAGLPGGDALGANIRNSGILSITHSTITAGKAAGGGGAGGDTYATKRGGAGGGGGGFLTTFGARGGSAAGDFFPVAYAGQGGKGAGFTSYQGGYGGNTVGGSGGYDESGAYSIGGVGGTAANGSNSIGGGGGGAGYDAAGGRGGNSVGGIYNTGLLTIANSNINNNIGAGGGGGGGDKYNAGNNDGPGGSGTGAIWNAGGTVHIDAGSLATFGSTNAGGGGYGAIGSNGSTRAASGTSTSGILTTGGAITDTTYATAVATTAGGTTAFTEGNNVTSTPVVVDSGLTVTDADYTTLARATVAITGNLHTAEDSLAFTNDLATMGNISGVYTSSTGVLALTSSGSTATVAQWQAALRSVVYTNSSNTPNTSNRTISFTVNDGLANSPTVTKTVSVASVDDTPVDTASGGNTAFTEGNNVTSPPVAVDSSITVADLDNGTLASTTVAITSNFQSVEDLLAFTNNPATMGNISGSYNSGTGVLTLTSSGATTTVAQWQAALRSVTYTNSSNTPNTSNRTISFTSNDGTSDGNTTTKTVTVASVNDTPIVTSSGGSAAFIAGDNISSTPVAVDSGVTISDLDSSTLATATVAITGNFQSGEDILSFTNNPATMGNISGSYNSSTGILTLTSSGATATLAQWQAALRSVTYTDSAVTPNTATRTFSFVANDGSSDSATTTRTVTVADTNQTPILATSGGTTAFTEGNNVTSTPVVIDSGLTVADADNSTLANAVVAITANFQSAEDSLSFTNNPATMGNISALYDSGTGVLTLSSPGATATQAQWQAALRSITYTDSSDTPNTGNRTISFTINDGTEDSNTVTKTVSVASVDDTPVDTASGGNTTFTEGNNATSTPVAVDSGFTVTDLDNSTLASATVAITGNLHTSEDVLAFTNNPATMGNIIGSYDSSTGVLTLTSSGATATTAQWQAALRSVTYTNGSNTPNTSNRTISFTTNDGTADGNTSTKTVTVASVNDSPIVTSSGGSAAFIAGDNISGSPVVIDSGVTISDLDSSTLSSATVAITGNFHSGEDLLLFTNNPATMGNISGSYNSGTGVLTLTSSGATATLAQWQAALRSVTYTDSAITPNTTTRTFSFVANDGSTDSAPTTRTASVTATDQTPILSTTGGSIGYLGGSAAVVIDGAITVSDLDNSTQASSTISIGTGFHVGDTLSFNNISATLYGNISASYVSGTGILTLTSSGALATNAQWANALSSVTFSAAMTVTPGNRTISFVVNDGTKSSAAATDTVAVVAGPIVTADSGSATFSRSSNSSTTPVVIDAGLTIADASSATLSSGTVAITGNFQTAEDGLAFTNNPATMGDIVGSYNASTGVLTLTSAGGATVAQWQAALDSVTYTNSSLSPNLSARTVSFGVTDGNSNVSNAATRQVTVADTASPAVISVAVPTNGTYGAGQNLDFTVTYDEPVTIDTTGGTPYIVVTLASGAGHANYISGSGSTTLNFRYTISSGDLDADGIVLGASIVLSGSTIRDVASNNAGVSLNSVAATTGVLVDAVAPAVSSSNRQSPSGSTTNATSAVFRVTFSKTVTGVDASDFLLTATGSATGTIASISAVSGSIYDVTVNGLGGNGTLRLNLKTSSTGIADTASNAIAGGFTGGQVYTLDHTAPTVSAIVRQSPTALSTSASTVTFRVSFSEAVTGVDSTAFAVTAVNGSATGMILSVNAVSASLYDVTVGSLSGLGLLRLDANASGAVVDSSGNPFSTAFTTGDVYEVGTLDVFNFTGLAQSSSRSVSAQLGFRTAQRFTTSATAPLTLFDIAAQILTASGAQPVVTINDDASGAIGSVVGTLTNPTSLIPNSLNIWSGNIPLAPNTTYWVVFDDASAAGLYAVSYTNATVGGTGSWATASDYHFDYYASGAWTTQAGGLRVDLGALAAASVSAPTPPANGSYHAGQNLDFTINFSTPVTVTGVPTLGLTSGSTAQAAEYVSGSGTNALLFRYIVQVGDVDADGIVVDSVIALNGGTIQDANSIDASLTFTPPVTTRIVIGTPAPAITSSATASSTFGSSFSYNIFANSVVPITLYSATGLPTGLAVDSATGAITGTPTQAGSFAISLGATNAAGTGASTLTLSVAKANATVALGALAQIYGATSAVTATTVPSALTVGITYNGTAAVPTDAGSYVIAATINDPNYQGSVSGTLVIAPADQTLSFNPGSALPLNQAVTLVATASSGLPVVYTLVSGPATLSGSLLTATGPGAIDVRASQAGNSNYNPVSLDQTLSSAKMSQAISFTAPVDHLDNDAPFILNAIASSGLPVVYTIGSGPATLSGETISLTGDDGTVSVTASQPGDSLYDPAPSVTHLFVVSAAYKSRLLNLSSRGHVGTGQNILIAGFIITGTESKRVVLRGVGPGLIGFGVQGVLAKPAIRLYDGARNLLMSNSGWTDDPTISAAFAEIGAVPFAVGSADSALVATLPPGGYTLQVFGQSDTTGVALAEVYDASTTASATHQRLLNFSSRGVVGTGENVLIGGFIITGSAPKRVLVRAIGPGLTQYGLTSALADPVLQLHDSSSVIATNDNWETLDNPANGDVAATTTQVGAIPLEAGSKDAALALTLAPGGYTAIVSGAAATTGVVLLEIYEVPQ